MKKLSFLLFNYCIFTLADKFKGVGIEVVDYFRYGVERLAKDLK